MRTLIAIPLLALGLPVVAAEPHRFVERTPPVTHPVAHTHDRAGTGVGLSPWAVPAVRSHSAAGYVNGTFATDFVGFRRRPGLVFRGPSADPTRGPSLDHLYRTTAAPVPDLLALHPLRNAILGSREAAHPHR